MLISIILPVYNVEKYIVECLRSIVAQTYTGAMECIIINDCTKDNSMSIIYNFLSEYSGNIVFNIVNHKINRGLSAARNTGLLEAKGDYVYFLDSDDLITPDCIERLVNPLLQNNYQMIVGDIITFGGHREIPRLNLLEGAYVNDEILDMYMQRFIYPMAVNKLCERKFLLDNDIYFKEGILHEDELWSFLLVYKLKTVFAVKANTYKYRIHEESIMAKKNSSEKTEESLAIIFFEMMKIMDERKFENKLCYYFFDYIRIHFMRFLFDKNFHPHNRKQLFDIYIGLNKINPIKAYRNGFISFKHLLRDLYLVLPKKISYYYWFIYINIRGNR